MKIKISKKVLITVLLVSLVFSFVAFNSTYSKMKVYYSGDAISFNGKAFIGTTNTGKFELFSIENNKIYTQATVFSTDYNAEEFYDLAFEKDGGKLYVYLVNGRYLYKYDITNPLSPVVVNKIKDNSWDWFLRVDVIDNGIATVGTKGTKIWNKDLLVIDAYKEITHKDLGSLTFANEGELMMSTKDDLVIFNTASRKKVAEFKLSSGQKSNKETLADAIDKVLYVVDDESLKAIDYNGNIKKEFKHTSHVGYDVVASQNENYIYFSDGIGVVKMRKGDFKPVDWNKTINLGIDGSWAMGMKAVQSGNQENLVIFNGSNILVLDKNLNEVDHVMSTEKEVRPFEDLSLMFDKASTESGSQLAVKGKGFGLNETVEIKLDRKTKFITKTDSFGRFYHVIDVPEVNNLTKKDVKATGLSSGRTYSMSFTITKSPSID